AEGDSVELLQDELEFLSRMARVSIQGKITSKKISTWLKSTFEHNSILAIGAPGDRMMQPEDRQDGLDQQHQHDDGYLSDSSYISNGDMTDPYSTSIKTRRPLRRAFSLEDLTVASTIHRQVHTSSALHSSAHPNHHRSDSIRSLISPSERPSSTASIYHRRQRHAGPPEEGLSIASLKGRPHSALAFSGKDGPTYSQDDHIGLPTPEVSPEELSESSEELVIIQGELLEEARLAPTADRIRASSHYHGRYPVPGEGADTVTIALTGEARPWGWLTDSPFIDALVGWIEGPDPVQQKNQDKDKPNPWFEIPLQFIALLTYPEPDPKNGNKMSLAMVRETSFVRQRRRTLLMLTAFTLVVRYCSFDFFIVVLFASNCAMLFLMKNSGRMNVNMAKRAVRQRVGWAKQWAGSIFRRGGNTGNTGISNTGSNNLQSPYSAEFARHQQSSPAMGESTNAPPADASPQMKRRGLFGKRKTADFASTQLAPGSSTQAMSATTATSVHGNYGPAGDSASVMSATPGGSATQKRRFFKRNNAGSTSNIGSSASASHVPISAPIPIQSKTSSSSLLSAQYGGSLSTATRITAMNIPLSSSPLAQEQSLLQSQSLPHFQFSPRDAFSSSEADVYAERTETRWSTKSQSTASTPPSLIPGVSPMLRTHGSMPPLTLPPPRASTTSPSPALFANQYPITLTHASPPLKTSGLSQLMGRCCSTTGISAQSLTGPVAHERDQSAPDDQGDRLSEKYDRVDDAVRDSAKAVASIRTDSGAVSTTTLGGAANAATCAVDAL
ncbi:hypothetical protein BGZ58_000881, partial [Dissophora ornata]